MLLPIMLFVARNASYRTRQGEPVCINCATPTATPCVVNVSYSRGAPVSRRLPRTLKILLPPS